MTHLPVAPTWALQYSPSTPVERHPVGGNGHCFFARALNVNRVTRLSRLQGFCNGLSRHITVHVAGAPQSWAGHGDKTHEHPQCSHGLHDISPPVS